MFANGDECDELRKALITIDVASRNKSLGANARKEPKSLLKLYGPESKKAGDKGDNGVTVNTGSAGPGILGGPKTEDGKTTINIDLAKAGAEAPANNEHASDVAKAAAVAHEGEHGVLQKAYGMPSSPASIYSEEQNAYRVESYVDKGWHENSLKGLWTVDGGFSQQQIDHYALKSTQYDCRCSCTPPDSGVQQ